MPADRITRISCAVTIQCPIDVVFDYITTPAFWSDWIPITLGVEGSTEHPMNDGEHLREHFSGAGIEDYVSWEVRHRIAPHYWRIEGTSDRGIRTAINYTLATTAQGTRYEREFYYWGMGPILQFWDWAFARRRLFMYSQQALQNVKERLELGRSEKRLPSLAGPADGA